MDKMDLNLERDPSSALGSLFQQIINDMKNTSPLWEDFVAKACKLHACLRAAIQAIAAYLDAFQKIADAATNSRGASKEIGTALTRVCLRHKAVETRLKTFTTAIMDCLVQPLQDKLEDWKRTVATIDKEHAKEYKRCRTELKKRSSDTLRLQKKARKGQSDTIQSLMDSHMQDVTLRRAELEEVEKKSLRSAMVEERMRYCTFVHMLQPVVKEECEVMSELGHLQEAMQSIALVTKDPTVLPQASEELIHDAKATMTLYPESPGGGSGSQGGCSNSLGSRKSSVCSISSMNSSGSSSSPGHHHYPRSLSQLISPAIRLKPGESSDSGFCSSPALTTQASTATSQSHAVSTWPPHSQDAVALPPSSDRPHTISSAYEKGHQRPPLTVYTFQNPETILEGGVATNGSGSGNASGQNTPVTQKSPAGALSRPPLPVRCSSLERPLSANNNRNGSNLMQRQCPSPIPAHITKELSAHHAQQQQLQQQQLQQQQQQHQQMQSSSPPPTYVNMSELANMAALKITNQQQQQQQQQPLSSLQQQHSIDSISSQLSNDSANFNQQSSSHQQPSSQGGSQSHTPRSHSISSSSASSNTPSLHSHPSIDSTVATPLVGQTPTPSSGSSTPQNHYSPLLTNSPSSTAAGTPSGGSMTSGITSGFVYNVNSPTPPQSATGSSASDVLKITETNGAQPTVPPTIANDNTTTKTDSNSTTDNAKETNENSNTAVETDSPTIVENDERSRASVLQKASMFEKAAAASASNTPQSTTTSAARVPLDGTGIYGTRRTEVDGYRSGAPQSIQHQQQQQQAPQQHQQLDQQDVGGTTRIARRSSINTAKPPPPVRRSSSVTPSHNATAGSHQQYHQQQQQSQQTHITHAAASNLLHQQQQLQQQNAMHSSTESLPPPPAYLLDAHPAQSTPTAPPSVIPNSSLKVAETVKALSAMRHQPASPIALHHLQQQQQQQQPILQPSTPTPPPLQNLYSTTITTTSTSTMLLPDCESDYDCDAYSYYNPYVEVNAYIASTTLSAATLTNPSKKLPPIYHKQSQSLPQPLPEVPASLPPPPASPSYTSPPPYEHHHIAYSSPPPLPPPNQNANLSRVSHNQPEHTTAAEEAQATYHQQQNHLHHQHQQQLEQQVNGSDANYGDDASFRTSSPGIYAQPKIVTNMSSFRSASPGPNGHHHMHQPQAQHPNQPKTNPNLIAQLNARLSKQHHQQNASESLYGSTPSSPNHHHHHHQQQQQQQHQSQQNESIYMRNYSQQQQQQQQLATAHQHQQQNCDGYGNTNIEKAGSIRSKTKAEFLENLNAKLAKQGMSGRAFAVRNLINSKALPDPRLCHESLMDQIKRGATLKRNQKINDRSAPKIH